MISIALWAARISQPGWLKRFSRARAKNNFPRCIYRPKNISKDQLNSRCIKTRKLIRLRTLPFKLRMQAPVGGDMDVEVKFVLKQELYSIRSKILNLSSGS